MASRQVELQKWRLFAPLLKEKQRLPIGSLDKWEYRISGFLWRNRTYGAFWKLVRAQAEPVPEPACLQEPLQTTARCSLESLPEEILELVLRHLTKSSLDPDDLAKTYTDVIALGFCSRALRQRVLRHIQHEVRKSNGSWAGTPLFCLGSLSPNVPPCMTAPVSAMLEENADILSSQSTENSKQNQSLSHAMSKKSTALPNQDVARSWRHAAMGRTWANVISHGAFPEARSLEMVPPTQKMLMEQGVTEVVHIPGTELRSRWHLRNLVTRQFVRLYLDADMDVAEMETDRGSWLEFPKCVYVEGSSGLSLDAALLIRIWWSGPSRYFPPKHGSWAGHCFEVTRDEPQGWEDVTLTIVAEAEAMGIPKPPNVDIGQHRRNYKW